MAAYALVLVLAIALVYGQPQPSSDIAVIAPPWSGRQQAMLIVVRAGGDVVDRGRWPFLIVARSVRPGFVDRLYRGGALLVFNPDIVAGCAAGV
ncbi:MAG: hypothetical protein WDN06_11540 [Asticcacaulis sp.]